MVKHIALFEVVLLVVAIFSFAYIAGETRAFFSGESASESEFISIVRETLLKQLAGNIVSAQSESPVWTCPTNNKGTACQEYVSVMCEDNCAENCFPGPREDFAQCALGYCVDMSHGTCTGQAPRAVCENAGGNWFAQEPALCTNGCCLYAGNGEYTTEIACNYIEQTLGVEATFQLVGNEVECLILAQPITEGACVYEAPGGNLCEFTSSTDCQSNGGSYYPNTLCSHATLETICEQQASTGCIEGKSEVYWLDSCGNRENIYDANRVRSYNNGKVLSKSESCSLGSTGNAVANQASCGNCYRFGGDVSTACGLPNVNDVSAIEGDYVCRDLSCIDEFGETRVHGESWCAFDSQIGPHGLGNDKRSVDVPGSRHYQQVCVNGEINTAECQDFRNGVCVETFDTNAEVSTAACVINEWQSCIEYNTQTDGLDKCEDNDLCTIKSVNIDSGFAFDLCTPKYPGGFDIHEEGGGEEASLICGQATQTCTIVYVKKISGGWDCEENCNCLNPAFTETMNNLCMSLGDCGAHVTLTGEWSDDGANIGGRAQPLSTAYQNDLRDAIDVSSEQIVHPPNLERTASLFGAASGEGVAGDIEPDELLKNVEGMAGVGAYIGALALFDAGGYAIYNLPGGSALAPIQGLGPTLGALAGAVVGAIVGAAVTAYLLKITGVGAGISGDLGQALVMTGTLGGALVGSAAVAALFTEGTGAALQALMGGTGLVGVVILVVVVVVILVLKSLGIGDTKERHATFECLPWQPPRGGADCSECGANGLPCSRYKCQSLGYNCQLVNEDTSEEACIDVSPDDSNSPVITPWNEPLSEGYRYSETTDTGFSISESDGECIPAFTPVTFGISLDEPASCRFDVVDSGSYDDMEHYLGGSNLLRQNHEHMLLLPSLASLDVPDIDPNAWGEFTLHIRCMDGNGNANVASHAVSFCVSPQIDQQAPIIQSFTPQNPGYAQYQSTEFPLQWYMNEPAECRWDSADVVYDAMQHQATCATGFTQGTIFGWGCSATLPVTQTTADETFYIRCLDQPWLATTPDPERERNANTQSTSYTVKKTLTPLSISNVVPVSGSSLVAASSPVPLTLSIKTSGGMNGKATCSFDINGGIGSEFWPTGGTTHVQHLSTGLFSGTHTVEYTCEDMAGNTASATTSFSVIVDSSGPLITRAYNQGGTLYIITDEASTCTTSVEGCSSQNTLTMSGSGVSHTAPFEGTLTTYVSCRDGFNNPSSCLVLSGGYV